MNRQITLATLSFLVPFLAVAAAGEAGAVLPAQPREALSVLPEAPDGWEIVRSDAESSLTSWLEVHAVRIYRLKPKPGDPAPASPVEVEVSLSDAGGYKSSLADFANFEPGKGGKHLLGSYPAILSTSPEGTRVLEVLLGQRFIVNVTITGSPTERPERWIQALSFDALRRLLPGRQAALPRQVEIAFVDELHPERARSYSVARSNAAAVDAAARKAELAAQKQAASAPGSKAN